METLQIERGGLRDRLMKLYMTLDAYPEVLEVLTRLKRAGLRTAILSNGTPGILNSAVESAGLTGLIDIVLSVEDVGVFKPDPMVYQHALDNLGLDASEISFQSSNGGDAYAASAFGMRVVWCNRSGQTAERLPGRPDRVVKSLEELPSLVCAI